MQRAPASEPSGLLRCLFAPASVAVYGASATDPTKLGNTLLRNALAGSAGPDVVAVNPSGATVEGVAARPSLDVPVDLALMSVPGSAVETAVVDAAAAGAGVAVVLSSGFGETGEAGRAAEDRLRAAAAAHGMRLVGPNCMGIVSRRPEGGWLNGSYFWSVPDRAGGLAFISQSGAFGGMLFRACRERGLGISRFASLGNSVDVNETDVLEALALDDETSAIGLFVEGLRDGRRFVEVARRTTAHKPVVVLKAGKASSGARAAASHTGSIAGSHAAANAAFRRAGVVEADTSEDLFDALASLGATSARGARRVAIVTISGGPGVLAADAAERSGLELPAPTGATTAVIRRLAPSFAAVGNPIDLTPQCPPDGFEPAIRAIYEDESFDAVVAINCGLDIPEFGDAVVAAAGATGKPTSAFVLDVPRIRRALDDAGIPCFDSPERAAGAFAFGVQR